MSLAVSGKSGGHIVTSITLRIPDINRLVDWRLLYSASENMSPRLRETATQHLQCSRDRPFVEKTSAATHIAVVSLDSSSLLHSGQTLGERHPAQIKQDGLICSQLMSTPEICSEAASSIQLKIHAVPTNTPDIPNN